MAKLFTAGEWVGSGTPLEVRSPFSGEIVDTVPQASVELCERALRYAEAGAKRMRTISGYDRSQWLSHAATRLRERSEEFARTITAEEGKTLAESRAEVGRAVETLTLSAEEAKRIAGRGVPIDGAPDARERLAFTVRVPCGVVLAVTPFNFPLNLVAHKVGPGIAAGNSVILKPASATPLTAIKLAELLLDSGVPADAIQCLVGSGGEIGERLCSDPRVRKISFTGSVEVGERIGRAAGAKRVTMELGGNSPLLVMDDADLALVVKAAAVTSFGNAGQTCISTQRIVADRRIVGDLVDALKPAVAGIRSGDPTAEDTTIGPMVRAEEAERVAEWIAEAKAMGGKVVVGGNRTGSLHEPTLLTDVPSTARLVTNELFGPAVVVMACNSIEDALAEANSTPFGLSAGIFTRDVGKALRFIRDVEAGNLHINWAPGWRADLMPYGGLKMSGFGKEGPADAVDAMTEEKTVVFHPTP
jgi:acyl-CoA reductase-like NAD-dependent aldehyde dehydrogenase